jgi:hypothetical protein
VLAQRVTGFFVGVNSGLSDVSSNHLLVPWSRKGRTISLHTVRIEEGLSDSTMVYRDFSVVNSGRREYTVPSQLLVPWSRKSRAIHIHLLRTVESLIPCKRGYLFFPRGK